MEVDNREQFDFDFDSNKDLVGPKGILIVEDDPTFSEVLAKIIKDKMGLWSILAHDGFTAWKILEANHRCLRGVVADIGVPMFDGLNLLKMVRDDQRLQQIKFVILTNYATPENRDKADIYRANAFLDKQDYSGVYGVVKRFKSIF